MSYSNSTIGLSAIQEQLEKAKHYCQSLIEKYESNIPFKGHDGRYHYIYLSYHKETYKFYIGKHSSKDFLSDEYTGSGRLYGKALKKHGRAAFEHHHLAFFNTPEEALAKEAEEVTLEMIENTFKGQIYNLQAGGFGVNLSKESRERQGQSLRDKTSYSLIKGAIRKDNVNREEVLPLLKEGWVFIDITAVKLHHPLVDLRELGVKRGYLVVKKSYGYFEQDIIELIDIGFVFGRPLKKYPNPCDQALFEELRGFLDQREKRGFERIGQANLGNGKYTLKLGSIEKTGVTREDCISLLREGWKLVKPSNFEIYHPLVDLTKLGKPSGYLKIGRNSEFFEQDIIELIDKGFVLGVMPLGYSHPLDSTHFTDIKDFLDQREKKFQERRGQTIRDNKKYLLTKGEVNQAVPREEVLKRLKEGYRFLGVSVLICQKVGKFRQHLFYQKGSSYDREEQHLKLIQLLESGLWQLGVIWG